MWLMGKSERRVQRTEDKDKRARPDSIQDGDMIESESKQLNLFHKLPRHASQPTNWI